VEITYWMLTGTAMAAMSVGWLSLFPYSVGKESWNSRMTGQLAQSTALEKECATEIELET
jgi:hypothetical protein